MKSLGVQVLKDLSTQSSIGLQEGIRFVTSSARILKDTKRWVQNNAVDLFLAIDGQGRNLPLGASIQKLGIKTAYFFPPLIFLLGGWNVPKLRKYDLLLCPFAANAQVLKSRGCSVVSTGHPFSLYPQTVDKRKAKSKLALDPKGKVLALFPGSRYQEVEKLTGIFLQTAGKLKAKYEPLQILLALSHEAYRPHIEAEIRRWGVKTTIIYKRVEEVMAAADFLLAASGTTTLQAAFHYLPTAIVYRLSPLSTWVGRRVVKGNFFGLPNILAKEELFKEFLNRDCNPDSLYDYIEGVLFDKHQYQEVVRKTRRLVDEIRVPEHDILVGTAIYDLLQGKTF